jgi:hypothetical protein
LKSCVCIAGWYFPEKLYDVLTRIASIDFYILSHRPIKQIPAAVLKTTSLERIIFAPNIGYDWGAYQQFLDLKIFLKYDFCFFCHDDIQLKNADLFAFCIDRISSQNRGACIIGNGRQTYKRDWPKTHIQSYAHSGWKPSNWNFMHDTVRGSFWATSRQVLELISPLEVLWDHRKLIGVGSGNWSLRATCGKAQDILGDQAFLYLSDAYMSSDYLNEYNRGNPTSQTTQSPLRWKILNRIIVAYARALMTTYMNAHSDIRKRRLASLMSFSFDHF